jgi:predicted ribosomally synthesized peptide with SipW-like signal peptide
MKKKILIVSLVVAVLATAIIGGTLAWFTDTEEATNVFTVGDVSIELREPHYNGTNFTGDAAITENLGIALAGDIMPGRVIPKDPTVKNVGTNPCYVRVKMYVPTAVFTVLGPYADPAGQTGELPGLFGGFNETDWRVIDGIWTDETVDGVAFKVRTYNYETNNGILTAGTVVKLFDNMIVPSGLTNADRAALPVVGSNTTFGIRFVAEAIQSEGFNNDANAAWAAFVAP